MIYFKSDRITPEQETELGLKRLEAEAGIANAVGSTPAGVALLTSLCHRLRTNRYDISSIMPKLRGSSGAKHGGRPKREQAVYVREYASAERRFHKGTEQYILSLGDNGNIDWPKAGIAFAKIGMMIRLIILTVPELEAMVTRNNVSAANNGREYAQSKNQAKRFLALARAEQAKYDDIRSKFVSANIGLALHYCEHYYTSARSGMDRDDIVQEAMLGMIHAAEMWDPNKGIRFGTYASLWIKQYIRRHLDLTCTGNIAIPVWRAELKRRFGRKYWAMLSRTGEIDIKAIAEETGIKEADILETLEAYRLQGPSLSSQVMRNGEPAFTIDSFLASDEDLEDDVLTKVTAEKAASQFISGLTPIEERIIRARYGLNGAKEQTLEEIGRQMKRSRERIRQIEAQALSKLRSSRQPTLLRIKREVEEVFDAR